ncbi:MAG: hypothetical protein HUU54_04650 [Ignavibacteriaceae bacterium]|nr:hypothetical protein [Ignavibacteriaceae bacterium]
MKKILINLLVLFAFSIPVWSQSSNTPSMKYYSGGEFSMNMQASINTMGGGLGSGNFGRVFSPRIGVSSATIFSNPAELALLNKASIFFDSKFTITSSALGVDFNKLVDESLKLTTDDFLKDTNTFILDKNGYKQYGKTSSFEFGQPAAFGSFAISFPVYDKLVLGFGVYYPMDLSIDMYMTGIKTKLNSTKSVSGKEVIIDLPLQSTFAFNFLFRVNSMTLGGGYQVYNGKYGTTNIGLAVARYEVTNYFNLLLNVDGMIIMNKNQEYHYNNPNDPNINTSLGESNNFNWKLNGNFTSTKWGFRFGATHNFRDFNFVFAVDILPKFELSDDEAYSYGHQPSFMKGRLLGEDEDALDILIDSLKLDKPNLTKPVNNPFPKGAEFSFPSTITIGVDAPVWEHAVAFNLVKYISDLSYKLEPYEITKKANIGFKGAIDLKFKDELKGWGFALLPFRAMFFDFDGLIFQLFRKYTKYTNPHYIMSGGLFIGDANVKGFGDPSQSKSLKDFLNLPLPTGLSLSREYTIFNSLRVGVVVFGIPDFALRFGVDLSI